jgi:hypothetical protein
MGLRQVKASALAVAAGLAIAGLAALPAGAASAAKVRVTITGVDSNGVSVGVLGSIYPVAGGTKLVEPGKTAMVRPGTYWIGASVPTGLQQTLVMRKVTIRRSQALKLRAAGGSQVSLTLNGATATGQYDQLNACVNGVFVSGAAAPHGFLYAVPVKSRTMQISYQATWQNGSAEYAMAGRAYGGIPAHVSHATDPARMAKVNMVLYGGNDVYYGTSLQAGGKGCNIPELGGQESPAPGTYPVYLTPGSWTTSAFGPVSGWSGTHKFQAGHSYTSRFGTAVAGPDASFPVLRNPGQILYVADGSLFADPVQGADQLCTVCAKFKFALRRGTRIIASTGWQEEGSGVPFQPAVRRAGWYTLQVNGNRHDCCGPTPAGLISPDVSVRWHFFVAHPLDGTQPLAASATRYRALGLNIDNQAAAGSTTKLTISVRRARGGYLNAAGYNVKTIAVRASFDGGKTWHTLKLTRHGSGWTTTVQNPQASGFVSLRSTVTDGRGDSTVQTIDQAYGIS